MRVKNKIALFGSILFGIVVLISVAIYYKVRYNNRVNRDILTLDSVQYLSIDGSRQNISSSANFKTIFFFNSECDHCQAEARLISAKASSFENSDVYFFSTEELPSINKFANEFHLIENPGFKIGQVDHRVAYKMGVITYPMCYIYSPDGKLLKRYTGEVKTEAIVKYFR